jgi:hypothetical protein
MGDKVGIGPGGEDEVPWGTPFLDGLETSAAIEKPRDVVGSIETRGASMVEGGKVEEGLGGPVGSTTL